MTCLRIKESCQTVRGHEASSVRNIRQVSCQEATNKGIINYSFLDTMLSIYCFLIMTSNIISNLSLRNYFLHLLSQIPDSLRPNNLHAWIWTLKPNTRFLLILREICTNDHTLRTNLSVPLVVTLKLGQQGSKERDSTWRRNEEDWLRRKLE